jgi:hypothetical protein
MPDTYFTGRWTGQVEVLEQALRHKAGSMTELSIVRFSEWEGSEADSPKTSG